MGSASAAEAGPVQPAVRFDGAAVKLGGRTIWSNVGLEVGRKLAVWSWPQYQAYFAGTAPAPAN